MAKLALLGGKPVRSKSFVYPPYSVITKTDRNAVLDSLNKGYLSRFASSPSPYFLGAGYAKKFEDRIRKYYGIKYAVSTNCCTAALHVALAAAGIGQGDEVIVTPWSFSASAKAPLYVGAIPVFADVEDRTFGLDPAEVEKKITKYTKAIIVVHLFGHPARMDEIMKIARKHKLIVIEDCAQAHGAKYHGKKVGTIGDIGCFSFGASKQITAGEGGVLVTNNKIFAEKAQMLRNHGEVLGGIKTQKEMLGILGYGYLMDEMSAALVWSQMGRIDAQFRKRNENAKILKRQLRKFNFLSTPAIESGCTHAFYIYPIRYDEAKTGVPLRKFVEALAAEGIPAGAGYYEPLYWNPVYKWRKFYGNNGYPYNSHPRKVEYRKGDCPVVERLYQNEMIATMWMHPRVTAKDRNEILQAIEKVANNFDSL